jgi:hypothetical protein
MRVIGLASVAAAVVLAMSVADARAADPVGGGRYVERHSEDGTSVQIKLTLANDGREFAVPSWAIVRTDRCGSVFRLASGNPADQIEPVPVLPYGHFKRVRYGTVLSGRFIRRGRMVVGRMSWRSESCRDVSVKFRARLTSRPNAARPGKPSDCDRMSVSYSRRKNADNAYEPAEQGLGCTSARHLARAWHASERCTSLPGPGPTCSVRNAVCRRINGGVWRPRASVRCSMPDQPANAAEFVYHKACRKPVYRGDGEITSWAINLSCSTVRSFPLRKFVNAPTTRCRSDVGLPAAEWCTSVAGYSCGARDFVGPVIGYNALCTLDANPFKAVRLKYDGGI